MIICLCKGIREEEFCALAACYGGCPDAMKRAMGLDESCCGRCEANVEEWIQDVMGDRAPF